MNIANEAAETEASIFPPPQARRDPVHSRVHPPTLRLPRQALAQWDAPLPLGLLTRRTAR
jgi:hypothetical protein